MEPAFEASTRKTSENAGLTIADVCQNSEQEHLGISFAAMLAERSNTVNQNPAVAEMINGFCLTGASPGDSTFAQPEAGTITKTDDGMDVRTIAERVTEAVMSPGGREAFETYANGKYRDWTAPEDLRIQLQNSGLHEWQARAMIRHMDSLLRSGVNLSGLANLPRQEFERQLRSGLIRHVNRPNS